MEIGVLQAAQRPRSNSQLTMGMFCQALMGALQLGQADPGVLNVRRSTAAWAPGQARPPKARPPGRANRAPA